MSLAGTPRHRHMDAARYGKTAPKHRLQPVFQRCHYRQSKCPLARTDSQFRTRVRNAPFGKTSRSRHRRHPPDQGFTEICHTRTTCRTYDRPRHPATGASHLFSCRFGKRRALSYHGRYVYGTHSLFPQTAFRIRHGQPLTRKNGTPGKSDPFAQGAFWRRYGTPVIHSNDPASGTADIV